MKTKKPSPKKKRLYVGGVDIITPLSLKGKCGGWRIDTSTIRRGEKIEVVNMRNAIYSGLKPRSIKALDWDFTVHKLICDGNLATSDHPNEIFTQWQGFTELSGNVLIGGLGIGMASIIIANEFDEVESVTTIELEQDVIRLIKPQLPVTRVPHEIVHDDLFKYIKKTARRGKTFNTAYFDIWSSTGEGSWMNYIVPLRRLMAKYHPTTTVYNWLESDMLGQIRLSLNTVATGRVFSLFGTKINASKNTLKKLGIDDGSRGLWIRVFKPFDVFKKVIGDTKDEATVKELMDLYTNEVGHPEWERTFGKLWDSWKKPTNEERDAILKGS